MTQNKRIPRPRRRPCIGDMTHRVLLQTRSVQAPVFGDPDFSEKFAQLEPVWAAIETKTGTTVFDGVNQDINVSHDLLIRADDRVTPETWVLLENGTRLNIVRTDPLDERKQFVRLLCNERGSKDTEAARA